MSSIADLPPPPSAAKASGIDDLPPPPAPAQPGYFDGAIQSTVDALPMIGGTVGGIFGTPADLLTGPAGTIGGAAIGGYLGTAAKNLINSYINPSSAPKTMTDTVVQPIMGGVEQGLMQGTGETVMPYVGKAAQALGDSAKWAGTKVLSSLGGVKPAVIKEYAQFANRINAAPSLEALKDISDEYVGKLAQDVEKNKLSVDQAKELLASHKQDLAAYKNEIGLQYGEDASRSTDALKEAKSNLSTLEDKASNDVTQKNYELKQSLKDAQNKLDSEHGAFVQALKDKTAPTDLAPQVVDAVDSLKKKVVDGSSAAFDALKDSAASMPKQTLLNEIDNHIQNQLIQGKAPVGSQAEGAIKSLQALKSQIDSLGDHLSMPDLKKIVQGLDKDINWTGGAGDFTDAASREKMGIRGSIDSYLKATSDKYNELMAPVSDASKLLSQVSGHYGTEAKAYSRLASIASKSPGDRELLYKLGQEIGQDFQTPVEQHLRARSLLSDPTALEQIKQSHPSYQDIQNLQAELAQRMRPGFKESQVQSALTGSQQAQRLANAQAAADQFTPRARAERLAAAETSSPQAQALANAQTGLDKAQTGLAQSQERLAPFKPLAPNIAGQTQAQQKLMTLGKGGNIELEDMFQRLGKLTNTDFVQAMKDQHTLAQFQKGATNGSRNTLMGALAGFVFGGPAGIATGGVAGRAIDQYGPAMTKKVLDAAIRVSESPSVATIKALDLPEPIKRNMIIGLENYLANGGQSTLGESALRSVADQDNEDEKVNRSPAKGPEAWARKGLQNLGISDASAEKLLQDPKAKELLIQASDLSPNSRAMNKIKSQIQKGWGQ